MTEKRIDGGVRLLFALLAVGSSCKPASLSILRTEPQKTEPLTPPLRVLDDETSEEGEDLEVETETAPIWRYPKGTFSVDGATWNWARAEGLSLMGPIASGCEQSANELSPSTNALLHIIAFAEGTEHRYDVFFTHAQITNACARHPRKIHTSGGLSSDAAGRYQFLSSTWDSAVQNLQLADFRSSSQDRAAVFLIERIRGVNDHAEVQTSFTSFSRWMAKLTNEWASIPGNSYGQAQKGLTLRVLWEAYRSAQKLSEKSR